MIEATFLHNPSGKDMFCQCPSIFETQSGGMMDEGDIFRFRFFEGMDDEDRDRIHQYIVQKQFETLEKIAPQNPMEYDDDTALTGD